MFKLTLNVCVMLLGGALGCSSGDRSTTAEPARPDPLHGVAIAALQRLSVPMAVTGQVVDEDGQVLGHVRLDVIVGPSKALMNAPARTQTSQLTEGVFAIDEPSAASLTLQFEKVGYYSKYYQFEADPNEPKPIHVHDLRVVLPRRGAGKPLPSYASERRLLGASGVLVDLNSPPVSGRDDSDAPAPPPGKANLLLASPDVGADGRPEIRFLAGSPTYGEVRRVVLRFSSPDGGFVVARPTNDRLAPLDMIVAPETGYQPELVLDGQTKFPVYFFFRCGGRYGRGVVRGTSASLEVAKGARINVSTRLQTDGSRRIETLDRSF
jgi:hypothetical protein